MEYWQLLYFFIMSKPKKRLQHFFKFQIDIYRNTIQTSTRTKRAEAVTSGAKIVLKPFLNF